AFFKNDLPGPDQFDRLAPIEIRRFLARLFPIGRKQKTGLAWQQFKTESEFPICPFLPLETTGLAGHRIITLQFGTLDSGCDPTGGEHTIEIRYEIQFTRRRAFPDKFQTREMLPGTPCADTVARQIPGNTHPWMVHQSRLQSFQLTQSPVPVIPPGNILRQAVLEQHRRSVRRQTLQMPQGLHGYPAAFRDDDRLVFAAAGGYQRSPVITQLLQLNIRDVIEGNAAI